MKTLCKLVSYFFFFCRNYNRGRKKPVSSEEAMEELVEVVTTTSLRVV